MQTKENTRKHIFSSCRLAFAVLHAKGRYSGMRGPIKICCAPMDLFAELVTKGWGGGGGGVAAIHLASPLSPLVVVVAFEGENDDYTDSVKRFICFTFDRGCIMYESNPRMPIPPGHLTRIKSRVGGNLTFVQVPVPRAFDTMKKWRNTLCIPIQVICININRDSSVKDCFQFYFVSTRVQ